MNEHVTYISFAPEAKRALAEHLVEPLIEAAAILVRDEIVSEINSSTPAGSQYRIPGTRYRDGKKGQSRKRGLYTASAPGQAPAEREGIYRERWQNTPAVREGGQVAAAVFNDASVGKQQEPLAAILEYGMKEQGKGRVAPRPHIAPAIDRAEPKIRALVKEASGG